MNELKINRTQDFMGMDIPIINWRDVLGYIGYYQVNDYGGVKSLNRIVIGIDNKPYSVQESILTPSKDKDGYSVVTFRKDNIRKIKRVHRLVAEAFIKNPDNLPEVNHKDENKSNNCVDNLEWCTHTYNNQYGTKNKRRLENTDFSKLNRKIVQKTIEGNFVKYFDKIIDVRLFGFDSSAVSKCCKQKYKHHKGFIWEYVK